MPSPWAPHAPLWVLCLQFPELRRLRPRPDRLLLVSSPEGCLSREPKPCWPGAPAPLAAKFQSRRGAEHLGVEQQVSLLQDLHLCQEASPCGRCVQLPPQCCWGAGPGQGVSQSTQLLRACYLTPGLCPHSDQADSPEGPTTGLLSDLSSDTQGFLQGHAQASEDETCNKACPPPPPRSPGDAAP